MTKDEIIATDMALPEKEDNPRVKWVRCDVSNKDDIRELNGMCSGSENLRVFYLAAYHHPDQVLQNPRIAWNINITALSEFLNTMENIKVLYYPSTEVVYGQGKHFLNLVIPKAEAAPTTEDGSGKDGKRGGL